MHVNTLGVTAKCRKKLRSEERKNSLRSFILRFFTCGQQLWSNITNESNLFLIYTKFIKMHIDCTIRADV